MNRAVRKYLRQVKRYLTCPASHKKKFLQRLEEEILLYCEMQEATDFIQLTEHFGHPKDVAADFLNELDVKEVSCIAYTRLKRTYLLFATVAAAALLLVSISLVEYVKTRQWISGSPEEEIYIARNGEECSRFWVKTNYRGRDVCWEYDSEIGNFFLAPEPEEWDGTEPYAVDIYFYEDGVLEHWTFGQNHMFWVRVFDV